MAGKVPKTAIAREVGDSVLYHSLPGLASPLVQYVDLATNHLRIQLPVCRLLAANIFDLFFTRGFSEKRYSFPVGFLFHDLCFRTKIF